MNIRTIIVDDERLARNELCFQLERLDDVKIIGQAGDGVQAIKLIEDLSPDLVLLDVQMPGPTGFEVAREILVHGSHSQVVFVTAYDQYAIEAFEVNAIDYLLKPVEPKRLEQTIQRARDRLESSRAATMTATSLNDGELARIVEYIAQQDLRREPLAVKVGERFLLTQTEDIIYASLADAAITIVTGTLTGISNYRTLDELQSHLDPALFWRVHRSHVVNINKIKEIMPWFNRNYILKMKDTKGTEIPVSRAQTKRLREHLSL